MEMNILEDKQLTNKYTKVLQEEPFSNNAPNFFEVRDSLNNKILGTLRFQNGPIKEFGVNGIMNEDLLVVVKRRLESFNHSKFHCEENTQAIQKIEETLMWLRKRTTARESKGIEGTHNV